MKKLTIVKLDHRGREVTRYPGEVLSHTDSKIVLQTHFAGDDIDVGGLVLRVGDSFHETFYSMPEYAAACCGDEWPEPTVPPGGARMEYTSKPVPVRGKISSCPAACSGDRNFEGLPFTSGVGTTFLKSTTAILNR